MLVSSWVSAYSQGRLLLVSGRVCVVFPDVSSVAPRYSSLEADEFDEGSAAEEADASVTRSSWSGGRALLFCLAQKPRKATKPYKTKNHEILGKLRVMLKKGNVEEWILAPWWGF